MVKGVGDDGVLLAEERFEDTPVGIETGGVENRVLRAEIVGNGLSSSLWMSWQPQMKRTDDMP